MIGIVILNYNSYQDSIELVSAPKNQTFVDDIYNKYFEVEINKIEQGFNLNLSHWKY